MLPIEILKLMGSISISSYLFLVLILESFKSSSDKWLAITMVVIYDI